MVARPWYAPSDIPHWAIFKLLDEQEHDVDGKIAVNFVAGGFGWNDKPGGDENMIVFAGARRTGYAPPSRTTFTMAGAVRYSAYAFSVSWDGQFDAEIQKRVREGRFRATVKLTKIRGVR